MVSTQQASNLLEEESRVLLPPGPGGTLSSSLSFETVHSHWVGTTTLTRNL